MSLRGRLVTLRATTAADVRALCDARPDLRALAREESAPYGPDWIDHAIIVLEKASAEPFTTSSRVRFSIVQPTDDGGERFIGCINLWGVEPHQRSVRGSAMPGLTGQARIGMALMPQERGRGFGTDALRLAIEYGCVVRGVHRLALRTLDDNFAMQKCAAKAGLRHEATYRQAMWYDGAFRDMLGYAILASEWPGYDECGVQ